MEGIIYVMKGNIRIVEEYLENIDGHKHIYFYRSGTKTALQILLLEKETVVSVMYVN